MSSQRTHISKIGKKLLISIMSSTCPHNMANCGPLSAEIDPVLWGTPANFNEFCVLAALWQRYCTASSSGRQLNFAALNRWCHLCSAGRPSGWALVHILVLISADLECRFETCCTWLSGNAGRKTIAKKSPSAHHRTTLSGYIFANKTHIDWEKNLLSSNISFRCPHNMVNFGLLEAKINPVVWAPPLISTAFASWQRYSEVVGVSQTLRRWILALTIEALQGKTCQDSLLSGGGRSAWTKISGGKGRPWGTFLVSTKLGTFCYLTAQTAPCYVQSFWHNIGVWQTDGQTDGQNCCG